MSHYLMPDVRKLAVTSTGDSQGCVAAEGRAMCRAMTPSAGADALQKIPAPSWVAEEPVPPSRRDALPEPQEVCKPFSLWASLKGLIGKDIMDATLPIGQHCPLTELQFRGDELECTRLLDEAALLPRGSMDRLLVVAAFAQSGFAAGLRPYKCLNPVMGETFELVRPEQGMRCVGECVHQDYSRGCRLINAWQAEGAQWTLTGEDEPKVSFWGASLDMHLNWTDNLTFHDGETFSWRKGTSHVTGLITGNLVITHKGNLDVHAHDMDVTMRLTFREPGMFSSSKATKHEMIGHLINGKGKKVAGPTISGSFDGVLTAHMEDGSERKLWEKNWGPHGRDGRFNYSHWTASLNEIPQGQRGRLPPTDTRFRPDVRAIEEGRFVEAEKVKQSLTDRLRQGVIDAHKAGAQLQPRWFELKSPDGLTPNGMEGTQQRYRFKGEYWQARKTGNWEGVPDIYEAQH